MYKIFTFLGVIACFPIRLFMQNSPFSTKIVDKNVFFNYLGENVWPRICPGTPIIPLPKKIVGSSMYCINIFYYWLQFKYYFDIIACINFYK